MPEPTLGPCAAWIDDIPASCCADADKRAAAVTMASNILYRFSGRRFPGVCERVVRPCTSNPGCEGGWGQWPLSWDYPIWEEVIGPGIASYPSMPVRSVDGWLNLPGCVGRCHLPRLEVPGPISGVGEILLDGEVLDPAAYRVAAYRAIVRVDGGTFPCSQDYSLGPDQPGTWQVTYSYGRGPGVDGEIAAQVFACEIAKFLCGGPCELSGRIREIVREGVSIVLDPLTYLGKKETGIPIVDLWLVSVNGGKLERRSTVGRLDRPARLGRID